MSDMLRYPQREAAVAYRIFGHDAVLISTHTNFVRLLNPTGSLVWRLCDGSSTVSELASRLSHLYDLAEGQAHSALTDFLSELHERQLIRWLDQPSDSSGSAGPAGDAGPQSAGLSLRFANTDVKPTDDVSHQ